MNQTNIRFLITVIIALMFQTISTSLFAQVPQKINYQVTLRDADNKILANQTVGLKVNIMTGGAKPALKYSETHTVTSNINGLVNLKIGTGTPLAGSFDTIVWQASTIKIYMDPTGGTNYTQLISTYLTTGMVVPYAFYAPNGAHREIMWEILSIGMELPGHR